MIGDVIDILRITTSAVNQDFVRKSQIGKSATVCPYTQKFNRSVMAF